MSKYFPPTVENTRELIEVREQKAVEATDTVRAHLTALADAITIERYARIDLAEARATLAYLTGKHDGAVESAQQIMADYTNEFGGTTS